MYYIANRFQSSSPKNELQPILVHHPVHEFTVCKGGQNLISRTTGRRNPFPSIYSHGLRPCSPTTRHCKRQRHLLQCISNGPQLRVHRFSNDNVSPGEKSVRCLVLPTTCRCFCLDCCRSTDVVSYDRGLFHSLIHIGSVCLCNCAMVTMHIIFIDLIFSNFGKKI